MEETSVNVQEVRKEYQAKKQEMSMLRSTLNSLNTEKEEAFRGLKAFRDKISAHTARIQELKSQRDSLTGEVKGLKEERDKLNSVVKEKAQGQRLIVQQKNEPQKSKFSESSKKSHYQLKKEIAYLERKLETEVMPFPKEQELNKKVKVLKVELKEALLIYEAAKEARASRVDFLESRKTAQEVHERVQEVAQKSQDVHVAINSLYDEIKKGREEEKSITEKYLKLKEEYLQMKKKQEELSKQLDAFSAQLKTHDATNFRSKIREKTAEVQEKIKKGKKLSTEDILAFQAMD